jgi:integrase
LGNLKAFFRFCHESKWLPENPADKIKAAKVVEAQIVPLTAEEFQKILQACRQYKMRKQAVRLYALVLVLRFTGLRIRDAVLLRRDALNKGRLFLRTAKSGTDVFCPLPPEAITALEAIPSEGKHFFWSGRSTPKSAVGDYQRSLRIVFKKAEVPRAFPHLFRHTFATGLLQDGTSIETVAVLLGHTSSKITARFYIHWVKGRQEKLEEEVKKSWSHLVPIANSGGAQ